MRQTKRGNSQKKPAPTPVVTAEGKKSALMIPLVFFGVCAYIFFPGTVENADTRILAGSFLLIVGALTAACLIPMAFTRIDAYADRLDVKRFGKTARETAYSEIGTLPGRIPKYRITYYVVFIDAKTTVRFNDRYFTNAGILYSVLYCRIFEAINGYGHPDAKKLRTELWMRFKLY